MSISLLSIPISLMAIIIANRNTINQKRINSINNNFINLLETEKLIFEHPNLLSLHNITSQEIKQNNLTHEEVVYILISLQYSQNYYEVETKDHELTEYRKNFLRNPNVKKAWEKFLKDSGIFHKKYKKIIDTFYLNEKK